MPRKLVVGEKLILEATVLNVQDAGNIALSVHGRVIWMPAIALTGSDPVVAEVVEPPKPKNGRRKPAATETETEQQAP